jgi:hypothetical protein
MAVLNPADHQRARLVHSPSRYLDSVHIRPRRLDLHKVDPVFLCPSGNDLSEGR